MKKIVVTAACLLFVAVTAQYALAGPDYYFEITNNSGASRDSLYIEFAGSGGTAVLTVTDNAAGCGAPTVTNPGSPWIIAWSSACVDNGEKITIKIFSLTSLSFSSGRWSDNKALAAGDVVDKTPLPALTDWGIGVLVLAAAAAAVLLLMRRRRVVVA